MISKYAQGLSRIPRELDTIGKMKDNTNRKRKYEDTNPDERDFPSSRNNDVVKYLNELMPKVPKMRWGALTNAYPTNAKLNELNRLLPHDKRWHLFEEGKNFVNVDGVTIRRKRLDSMT
ncbi:MAG: hypothetical protein GWN01_12910 [Nitrosopumilaceae archaeon]|nr:hypothetical protein [Nitrosopumilaceae archaeon]NIU01764.1 hypothetical protein [Nitrosopumilaceae archaeon]NIU88164.1 hypothetical protein [Nitrosopumilaceae archaeon]NIV66487.1 hypothetical protein [Nitrosopumilaceae archaeon]NIX62366.1 hypothetical protein [Nitrosopumilaceae archaeon]